MNTLKGNILIVDDDPDVLTAAHLLLKRHFALVVTDNEPAQLPNLLDREQWDVVLLDMNFELGENSGKEGFYWLEQIQKLQPTAQVIMMTAYGAVDTAVQAMKKGAVDFVLKPWQNERLVTTVNSALALKESRDEVTFLRNREKEITSSPSTANTAMIGDCSAMLNIRHLIERVAPTEANVLILGENGSGKEVIARELVSHSERSREVMVTVDLGSVPENLFESELFGHKKGAFTGADQDRIGRFQAANGGTLFLDEIGNIPLHLQSKLLTALEQRQVLPLGSNKPVSIDVRLICATNSNLNQKVSENEFREDLFYRINTVEIHLPPLRERQVDIELLLKHFSEEFATRYNKPAPVIDDTVLSSARTYHWPGNIRELRHAVERAIILSDDGKLDADQLLLNRHSGRNNQTEHNLTDSLDLNTLENQAIEKALKQHAGNISHAAKALGITRTSLYRRMEKYGL